jgi:Ulp1 family protease
VVNTYGCLIQDICRDDVVALSSFFMSRLAKERNTVEREWTKVNPDISKNLEFSSFLYSQRITTKEAISKAIFPVSEPLLRPIHEQGTHWTTGVMDFKTHEITYINSLQGCGQFSMFQEVSVRFSYSLSHLILSVDQLRR